MPCNHPPNPLKFHESHALQNYKPTDESVDAFVVIEWPFLNNRLTGRKKVIHNCKSEYFEQKESGFRAIK
tara:strand:- start:1068 stop:1277 length:210 start_codon:yes stop_codon:yes gene_type:complete